MDPINLNGINSAQRARLQQSETVRPKNDERPVAPGNPDQVTVSNRADEAARLIARAGDLGDVRQERVNSLREAIESEQYEVPSSTIADAIMREEGV